MNRFRERWIAAGLNKALASMPVTVVTGVRQSGKTTLVLNTPEDRNYISLDDIGTRDQARRDPPSLLTASPITIDEVQRAPEILLAIKQAVDLERRAGNFLLTGSANLALMEAVSESLAGRAVYFELPPFCPLEWLGQEDALQPIDSLFAADFNFSDWPEEPGDWIYWLMRGGFPPVFEMKDQEGRNLWLGGYVQTYLERDLRQLSEVSNLADFQRVMSLAAQRTGKLLNQSELARDAGITQPTCHRYLNLMETGYLLTRLQTYSSNPSSGLIKSKRLFWNDCSLGAYLAGIRSVDHLNDRYDRGFWLEQTLFQSIKSWISLDPLNRKVSYWRDRAGNEVDFILEDGNQCVAVEVKEGSTVRSSDKKSILEFQKSLGRKSRLIRGVILSGSAQCRPLGDNILALPYGWLVPAQ
jgi:uncharacterized protein